MKHYRNTFACLLAALLLVSCGGQPSEKETTLTVDDTQANEQNTQTEDLPYDFAVEKQNNNSENVTLLTGVHAEWEYMSEENSGDIVDDAVYKRNLATEEYLGVKLVFDSRPNYAYTDGMDFNKAIEASVLANDHSWQIINGINVWAVHGVISGLYLNMENVSSMNLGNPWWIPTYAPSGEGVYSAFTDASLTLYSDIYAMFFNKDIIRDMNMDNPYDLVVEGTWTLDKFISMCEQVQYDADGNGIYEDTVDRLGYLAKHAANRGFLRSTDTSVVNNSTGVPEFAPVSDRLAMVYDTLRPFLTNKDLVKVSEEGDTGILALPFMNGNYLFMNNVLGVSEAMRDSDTDFGIVPLPKGDEEQENYYSQIATSTSAFYLPVSLQNKELVGAVCETLSYYSYLDLVPTYYEVALKSKYTRDEIDRQMLDYIRYGASTDFTFQYSTLFATYTNDIINWAWADQELTSMYAVVQDSWNATLDELLSVDLPE